MIGTTGGTTLVPADRLDPADWDRLAGDRLYATAGWLRFCTGEPGGATVAVRTTLPDGRPAGVPATVVDRQSDLAGFYRWTEILHAAGLPAPGPAGLLVGPRRGFQTDLLFPAGTEPVEAARAILAAVREAAAGLPGRPATVGMFLSTRDVQALRAAGVRSTPVLLQADAWIPVPRDGFDGWLAGLSKGRRSNVRHERRWFAAAGYEVVHQPLAECAEAAGRLLAITEERYGNRLDPDQLGESFRHQARSMGPSARVVLALAGGVPVGFHLYYIRGQVLYVRAAGFDYRRLRGAAEYFNLVYYEPLRLAGPAGVRWIHAGIEAAEAKALRGAVLRPRWLLDLATDPPAGAGAATRAYNRRFVTDLAGRSPAIAAALEPDAWHRYT